MTTASSPAAGTAAHPRRRPLLSRALLAGALLLGGCAAPQAQGLQPFSSDGCSLFPDRAPTGGDDWCHCCLRHDLAYWRGGTAEERRAADEALQACVRQTTGNAALADLMLAGVRVGGGPYFATPYRWAYGWPYGRGYEALSAAERADADRLEAEYRVRNPALVCKAP